MLIKTLIDDCLLNKTSARRNERKCENGGTLPLFRSITFVYRAKMDTHILGIRLTFNRLSITCWLVLFEGTTLARIVRNLSIQIDWYEAGTFEFRPSVVIVEPFCTGHGWNDSLNKAANQFKRKNGNVVWIIFVSLKYRRKIMQTEALANMRLMTKHN